MRLLIASAVVIAVALGCATGEAIDETQSSGGNGGVSGSTAGAAGFVSSGGNAGASNGGTANGGTGNEPGTGGALGGDGGGGATGGVGGVGGATGGVGGATGGVGGVGGGTGGSGGLNCPPGQKVCASLCTDPAPGVGCSLSDCTPCPTPPANSYGKCTSGYCDFECNPNYIKQGAACVLPGTGGTGGGTGGAGGGTGCAQPCDPSAGEQQFICTFLCATQGKFGLCAPLLNCCVCS